MKSFINSILLLSASTIFMFGKGEKFSYSSVPIKDGKPLYERSITIATADKTKMRQDVKLFLASYFHKSSPKIVVDDADRLSAGIVLQYTYSGQNGVRYGRNNCMLDLQFTNEGCAVKVSDFFLEHRVGEPYVKPTTAGYQPTSEYKWTQAINNELYAAAADKKWWALNEVQAIQNEVLQLMDELEKKVKS